MSPAGALPKQGVALCPGIVRDDPECNKTYPKYPKYGCLGFMQFGEARQSEGVSAPLLNAVNLMKIRFYGNSIS
jgi:hypothetical protein